jgi:hypothetical protein
VLSKLHDDAEGTPLAGASSQEPDDVRVVDLLQEAELRQQVVQLLSAVVRLQHFDCYPTIT